MRQISLADRLIHNSLFYAGGLMATQASPYVFYGTTLALKVAAPSLAIFTLASLALRHLQSNSRLDRSYVFEASIDPIAFAVTMAVLPIFGLSAGSAVLFPLFAIVMIGRVFGTLMAQGIIALRTAS